MLMIYFLHCTSCQNFVPAWGRAEADGQRCCQRCCRCGHSRGGKVALGWRLLPAGSQLDSGHQAPRPGPHSAGLRAGWPRGSRPFSYGVRVLHGLFKTHTLNDICSSAHCLLHLCPLTRIFSVGNDALMVLPFEWHTSMQTGN